MGVSGGVIVSPERLRDDVAAVLGVSNASVGYLCGNAHGKINKWSYRKPIIYNKYESLSDSEFQGQIAEISKGIYCGISMGTNYGRMKELLEHSFTYHPPTGGAADPFRAGDFRGYDTAAVPTPTGTIYSPIRYNNSDQGITVEFSYNPNNTTGVNLKRFFESGYASAIGASESIDNCYLCIIVANANRSQYAYKALTNYNTKTITPIKYNGSYVTRWYTSLYKSDCPDMFNGKSNSTYYASLFLVSTLTPRDQFVPNSLATWTSQSYDSTANAPQGCIGVPLAINIPVTLINEIEEGNKPENKPIITTSISGDRLRLYINYQRNQTNVSDVYVWINANAEGYGGYGRGFNMTAAAYGQWSVLWNDLHIADLKNGTKVTVEIQLYSNSQLNNKYSEATYTITWTWSEETGLLG